MRANVFGQGFANALHTNASSRPTRLLGYEIPKQNVDAKEVATWHLSKELICDQKRRIYEAKKMSDFGSCHTDNQIHSSIDTKTKKNLSSKKKP